LSNNDYEFWHDYMQEHRTPDAYTYVEITPTKSEEVLNMEVKEFIDALMYGENYSREQVIVKYYKRIMMSFSTNRFYTYLVTNQLQRFIRIGKDTFNADALIEVITRNALPQFINDELYHMFNDTYKVYLQSYMYEHKYISKREYLDNMIELCGTPILNSKLIGSTSIKGVYLSGYVYNMFYGNFTGASNYTTWVGYTAASPVKPARRPNKLHDSFTVTLELKEKIPYLIDVINSGINYNVRFCKKFVNKSNIELLIDTLSSKCKKTRINTSLKQKIGNSIKQFNDDELEDLDDFVLKLRSINKTYANTIARQHKEACVGYNAYKQL